MMDKDLIENLENKKKYLFLSLDSRCLDKFSDTVIRIPTDGSELEKEMRLSVGHKMFLGKYFMKFTSFERTGFFDERYDVSISFGMNFLIQQDYYAYDSDGLKKDEMDPIENLMKKVVRRKGKFEYGDEMLLEEIDLNNSAGIIYYAKEAKKNIKKAGIDKKIISFDLINNRTEAFDIFLEFDNKIKNGKVREFEWN